MPTVAKLLIKSTLVDAYATTSIKHILCGGATLLKDDERKLQEKMNCPIQQAYGMTETVFITVKTKSCSKLGSCGSLIPGVRAKVSKL